MRIIMKEVPHASRDERSRDTGNSKTAPNMLLVFSDGIPYPPEVSPRQMQTKTKGGRTSNKASSTLHEVETFYEKTLFKNNRHTTCYRPSSCLLVATRVFSKKGSTTTTYSNYLTYLPLSVFF